MNQERLLKIILKPCISEKSTMLADKNRQFTFEVILGATKTEIKQAIELLFNVKVDSIQVCNIKGKRKIFKQKPGQRRNRKKAYVGLKEGYDINFAGVEG